MPQTSSTPLFTMAGALKVPKTANFSKKYDHKNTTMYRIGGRVFFALAMKNGSPIDAAPLFSFLATSQERSEGVSHLGCHGCNKVSKGAAPASGIVSNSSPPRGSSSFFQAYGPRLPCQEANVGPLLAGCKEKQRKEGDRCPHLMCVLCAIGNKRTV